MIDMDIREQRDRTKKMFILLNTDTHKEHVLTLLDCALLVINYVSFCTNYLMYH